MRENAHGPGNCLIGLRIFASATCRLTMSRHLSPPHSASSRPLHSLGITAGAEDTKYQAKYKDLKRKVREIEGVRPPHPFFNCLFTSTRAMTGSSLIFYRQSGTFNGSNLNARTLSALQVLFSDCIDSIF